MQRSFKLIKSGSSSTRLATAVYNNQHHISIPYAANFPITTTTMTASQQHVVMSQHLNTRRPQTSFHTTVPKLEKVVPFNLADIGEGILEVEVMEWFVKEGQEIHQFDKVAQVQSDKATVEITSRYDGVVKKLHHQVGDMAQVGQPLIDIAMEGEAEAVPEVKKEEVAAPTTEKNISARGNVEEAFKKVLTTPAVRHIARQKGVDLSQVKATGRNGRVLKEDLLNFLQSGGVAAPATETTTTAPQSSTTSAAPSVTPLVAGLAVEGDRVEKVRGITKAMIKTMSASTQIPHLGLSDEIEMNSLIKLRQELKELSTEERLTFMPFFIKAASLALEKYPILNAQLSADQTEIIYKASHNIGIAMDTPQGLLVPNVKNVNNLTVYDVAKELNRLIAIGKEGKLGPEELGGGTFTLSNIGSIGGTYTRPVISSPEVVIGAIGKTQKLPRFDEKGEVVPVSIMYISWSADHRIIDGATITRFSNLWKELIEQPLRILYGN